MDLKELSIAELAERANVTPRTIRHYIDQGVLPPGRGVGRDQTFGPDHLARLRVAKALRALGLQVRAIRSALESAPINLLEKRLSQLPPDAGSQQVGEVLTDLWRVPAFWEPAYESLTYPAAPPAAMSRTASFVAKNRSPLWVHVPLGRGVELHYQESDDPRRDSEIRHIIVEAQKRLSGFD